MHIIYRYSFLLISISTIISCQQDEASINPPNIVYIFTDDLGYGDLGCFGAIDIKTPHIDRIAREGMKFTDLYSASSVCSPSRAGLLTGRYPQRWGLHGVYFPNSLGGMPSGEVTIAEVLKTEGYHTGHIGKWHLGHTHDHLPLQQGFDSYFGIPYSNDMESVVYMRDNSVAEWDVDQTQMIKRYAEESIDFINQHKGEPFYLYLAHNMPHVPIYASEDFVGTSERGLYGDVIQEIDWSVGQLLEALDANGILENTIVVFSSDNGPWLVMEDHGGSAGPLREGKQYTFDGGVRVPAVAMWPGHIKPGTVHNGVISQMDWFPTFAHITGAQIADTITIDGYNIIDVLEGTGDRVADEILLFGIDGKLCGYRHGDYKLKVPFEGFEGAPWRMGVVAHDTLLINMINDPGEQQNLLKDQPDRVRSMYDNMYAAAAKINPMTGHQVHRTPSDDYHYTRLSERYGAGTPYWKSKE